MQHRLGQPEQAFLRDAFRAYYLSHPPLRVSDVAKREWMFIMGDGRVRRHLVFPDLDALHGALVEQVPWHVHHSMAFYEDPGNPDMPSKDSRGCQVLLDLDVKPELRLGGTGVESLEEALERARQSFLRVLDLLQYDLGIPFQELEVCFSGSKGYHARIGSPAFLELDREARLELGRFLTGTGATVRGLFPASDPRKASIPIDAPRSGLRRRIWLALTRLKTLSDPEDRPDLLSALIERHRGDLVASPSEILDVVHATPLQVLVDDEEQREVLRVLYQSAIHLACPPIDLQVLGDMSRVGRLQGSINGKTGLVAKTLGSRKEVEGFNPFVHANPFPRDVHVDVEGPEGVRRLDAATAIPLMARGRARLGPS